MVSTITRRAFLKLIYKVSIGVLRRLFNRNHPQFNYVYLKWVLIKGKASMMNRAAHLKKTNNS